MTCGKLARNPLPFTNQPGSNATVIVQMSIFGLAMLRAIE
jgi:hypothetical protein